MNFAKPTAVLFIILLGQTPASAASQLTLSSSGGSSFVLQGTGVEGAAAIECTITYDSAAYGNPRVELGALSAGAMMAVNPNTPGTVRVAIIRTTPMSGSGPIVNIAFERKGDQAGRASLGNVKMISIDGRTLPVSVQAATAAEPSTAATTASTGQEDAGRTGTVAPTGVVSQTQPVPLPPIGVAVVPKKQEDERLRTDDARMQREQGGAPDRRVPKEEPARLAKREADAPQSASRKIYSQKSVLDRFSEYKGKPTMVGYLSLFEQEGMIGFRQDPPVVLADGKSTVRVSFISSTPTRTTSDIAVMGATLLSLKKDPEFTNTFILELRPAKGELRASVSVPQDNVLMVFPLTLAPRASLEVGKKKGLDEAAFKAFLAESGTPEHPKYDLNNDGKRDYIDDYIFTANYLAAGIRSFATGTGR
jgi:hypothetical protein